MAKKRKKRKVQENQRYEIEVMDWEVYYHFGIAPKNLDMGAYWEISNLSLVGKIISPELKIAQKAKIRLSSKPEMEDHWTTKPGILSAKAIGFMEVPRGEDILQLHCSIPPRMSDSIHVAVASGKIKYVSVFGEKLKWRKGLVFDITLSAELEEE